jgi:hypothetical protein
LRAAPNFCVAVALLPTGEVCGGRLSSGGCRHLMRFNTLVHSERGCEIRKSFDPIDCRRDRQSIAGAACIRTRYFFRRSQGTAALPEGHRCLAESPHDDLALEGSAVVCEYYPRSFCVRERGRRRWGAGDEEWAVRTRDALRVGLQGFSEAHSRNTLPGSESEVCRSRL